MMTSFYLPTSHGLGQYVFANVFVLSDDRFLPDLHITLIFSIVVLKI